MKAYLIVRIWGNTKNNHAGMYYLAKRIKEQSDFGSVRIISKSSRGMGHPWFVRMLNVLIGCMLYLIVKKRDVVFLMEYLHPDVRQSDIARMLNGRCRLEGIAHLTPELMEKKYTEAQIKKEAAWLDRIYVLGSSLCDYLVRKGIPQDKIITTHHYVDTDFYKPLAIPAISQKPIEIICMGNMERNYIELSHIIRECPDMHFNVCMGVRQISDYFTGIPHVTLWGYMDEQKLLYLMQASDISLNVMNDTVGSNVITTSLGCGLAVAASNVGSIGDYVSDYKEGRLFHNTSEAVAILKEWQADRAELLRLRLNARKKAEKLSLPAFVKWFDGQMLHPENAN